MAAHRSGDSRRLDPLSGRFTDYIVIDTETTGLSVCKGAKLIEIGAVKIRNDELVDEFDQLINPFEHVPSRITGLTGIDDGMLLGKPDVREVMDEFARWCSDTAVVMAHNASFDMSFLDNAVQLAYSERDARLRTIRRHSGPQPSTASGKTKPQSFHPHRRLPHRRHGGAPRIVRRQAGVDAVPRHA